MHNEHALTEFIQGEERCLKFINQDLTFLQEWHIPSTFINVFHTTIHLTTNRPEHQPSEVPSDIHTNKDDNPEQQ